MTELHTKQEQKTIYKQRIAAVQKSRADLILKNARVVDVFTNELLELNVAIFNGIITGLESSNSTSRFAPTENCKIVDLNKAYLTPGLIDSHVHIESSMQTPAGFASVIVPCGTTTVIADPHEIANVSGVEGIRYFLDQAENLPLRIYTMMPSCVPCTPFESNGCILDAKAMEEFVGDPRVLGLGEVMNPSAVADCEEDMIEKLLLYVSSEKHLVDGHAPLVTGQSLCAYAAAGVQTDHECSTYGEVIERLRLGMKVILRVGSAANDVASLMSQIAKSHLPTANLFFCTDDKHTQDIREQGHINYILKLAIDAGFDVFDAVRMATLNPAIHYRLPHTGAVAVGYYADLVAFQDLKDFKPVQVIARGKLVFDDNQKVSMTFTSSKPAPESMLNTVHCKPLSSEKLRIDIPQDSEIYPVMELYPHQLLTKLEHCPVPTENGVFVAKENFAKIAVIERHKETGNVGVGIIKGFGIKNGAIASTVAHDSHNIIVVGDNDCDIIAAVNCLKEIGGGYAVASGYTVTGGEKVLKCLPLPIAGLITDAPVTQTQDVQLQVIELAHKLGIPDYYDPFISLSFLALPVIPRVRMTDLDLFDVVKGGFLK